MSNDNNDDDDADADAVFAASTSTSVGEPNISLHGIVARLTRIEEVLREQQRSIVALLRTAKRKARPRPETTTSPPPPPSASHLTIHTDGSSLGNGRRGASAGCGFSASNGHRWTGACPGKQTNQRAELYAALRALVYARDHANVCIASDSEYVVLGVNERTRLRQWAVNGWRTKAGSPVANRDLWQQMLAELTARDSRSLAVSFNWVKGHAGNAGNEAADALAVHAAKRSRLGEAQ